MGQILTHSPRLRLESEKLEAFIKHFGKMFLAVSKTHRKPHPRASEAL